MKHLWVLAAAVLLLVGCGSGDGTTSGRSGASGAIRIDGSNTVSPVSFALAEEFQLAHRGTRVSVSVSGTGGGFQKFTNGELAITGASRPISESELEMARANGIEFIELPIAFDGVSVLVRNDADFVDYLSVEELREIWKPGSTVHRWSDVRPEWPNERISLYGPGPDNGTYDYFTRAIMGETGASRADYSHAPDSNMIIVGVSNDRHALGFLGYSFLHANKDRLRGVPIREGDGEPVAPTAETIFSGEYTPLSRPIFYYVNAAEAERPEITAFVEFALTQRAHTIRETGYVPLPDAAYELALERFRSRTTGSVFGGGAAARGLTVEEILRGE